MIQTRPNPKVEGYMERGGKKVEAGRRTVLMGFSPPLPKPLPVSGGAPNVITPAVACATE